MSEDGRQNVMPLIEAVAWLVENNGRERAIGTLAAALSRLIRELPHDKRGRFLEYVKHDMTQAVWQSLT